MFILLLKYMEAISYLALVVGPVARKSMISCSGVEGEKGNSLIDSLTQT